MTVLVAESSASGRRALVNALNKLGYSNVVEARDGSEALHLARAPLSCVVTEWDLPKVDGLTVVRSIRSQPAGFYVPVLMVTSRSRRDDVVTAAQAGVNTYLVKPFSAQSLQAKLSQVLSMINPVKVDLGIDSISALERLALAAESRDDDTGEHTKRVGELSARIARALGLPVAAVEVIRQAAPLHDVGKIAIPDAIVLKPTQLTPEEFELMKTHTTTGAAILSDRQTERSGVAEQIAIAHHERWDGGGYPNGLKGADIPRAARIVAVADFFDSLLSERPYRRAWSKEKALETIRTSSGNHFDPEVVEAFFRVIAMDDPLGAGRERETADRLSEYVI